MATTTKSSNQVTMSFSVCTHQVVYHAGHPSPGSRTPGITHLSWGGGPLHLGVGSHQGKHSSQVLDGTTLPPQRRDRKISFSGELWSPVASSLSWWPTQGDRPMLQLSYYGERNPDPSCGVWNTESWQYAWRPLTYRLKQNQGVLTVPETGKDIPTQSDKPVQAVWIPHLFIRKSSRAKAHSSVAMHACQVEVERLQAGDCFFQQRFSLICSFLEDSSLSALRSDSAFLLVTSFKAIVTI